MARLNPDRLRGSAGGRTPRFVDRRAALAVAARPWLWGTAATLVLRIASRGWWRRWPPVPSPPPTYAEFRVHTALGGPPSAAPPPGGPAERDRASRGAAAETLDAAEVVDFLEWCRRMTLLSKRRGPG